MRLNVSLTSAHRVARLIISAFSQLKSPLFAIFLDHIATATVVKLLRILCQTDCFAHFKFASFIELTSVMTIC